MQSPSSQQAGPIQCSLTMHTQNNRVILPILLRVTLPILPMDTLPILPMVTLPILLRLILAILLPMQDAIHLNQQIHLLHLILRKWRWPLYQVEPHFLLPELRPETRVNEESISLLQNILSVGNRCIEYKQMSLLLQHWRRWSTLRRSRR